MNSARSFLGQTLKDQPAGMFAAILLRYRLSGNSHPGSAKNPGPDLALAAMCFWLRFSHNTEIAEKAPFLDGKEITL